MAKKGFMKFLNWINVILMALVSFGIGGLFINGTFLTAPILSMIPQGFHTFVGWLVVINGFWTIVKEFI